MRKFILGVILVLTFSNTLGAATLSPRILGGSVVPQYDDTWRAIVALKRGGRLFCAGSLIAPKWVLTAGHCVRNANIVGLTIGANSYNKNRTTDYSVKRIIVHEDLDYYTAFNNDIALIELNNAVAGVTPIAYDTADTDRDAGTFTKVAGWGRTSERGNRSNNLLEVSVPLISRDICNGWNAYYNRVTDNMLCAGYMNVTNGDGVCYGDSGGPMIFDNTLIGIVSWGDGCGRLNRPGLYTNVKRYADWIADKIGNSETPGDTPSGDTFETAHPYANDEDVTQKICAAKESSNGTYTVKINGEVESDYDFVTIVEAGERSTGKINKTLEVSNRCVTVKFKSDSSITKEGVVVKIEPKSKNNNTLYKDTFETAHPYANDEDVTQKICAAKESSNGTYTVKINGKVEDNYDFVTIVEAGERFTGRINKTLEVSNRCVTVKFKSDFSITAEGVVVKISDKSLLQ